MRRPLVLLSWLLIPATISLVMAGARRQTADYTGDFNIRASDRLVATGGNEFYSLDPGTTSVLEGEDDGQQVQVVTTVLADTQVVRFSANGGRMTVHTRVVQEDEYINGELVQVAYNHLARCPRSGNIYQFGKSVYQYVNGTPVPSDESWIAGKRNARPGLRMPGTFLVGSRYYLEQAPGVSMDRAENMETGVTVRTPAGTFRNCVTVLESTPLEPDEEVIKIYAPGVGLIVDDQLVLVDYDG